VLLDIAGRTMIEHVYRRATAASLVDHVIVATDDQRIADVVTEFGGVAVMTRRDGRRTDTHGRPGVDRERPR